MRTVHLVRHGEVHNPRHVVYADLPGFELSERGRQQAIAARRYLEDRSIGAVFSSPLERAVATAEEIARPHGLAVETDERLTEWHMADGWAGIVWEDLPAVRPGEVEAYLEHPDVLDFSAESLEQLAVRMIAAIEDYGHRHQRYVVVSHQDPVHATRRQTTGASFEDFHLDKPGHASVATLVEADKRGWGAFQEDGYWEPPQGPRFPPVSARR